MGAQARRRADCRLCSGKDFDLVLSLTPTPPANAFVRPEQAKTPQTAYPLDVQLCRSCGHAQLLDIVDPRELFEDYVYVSGTSPVFVDHFKRYAEAVRSRHGLKAGDLAVDVGSNDGTLLRFLKEAGLKTLGVDPARDIAARATAAGIETLPEFFDEALATRLRAERGPARLVTANNVFAHADDLKAFTAGVRRLLAPDGVFVFEVSYLGDVVEKTLFDTVYHEHLSYHSVRPLERFFRENGMELIEAERVDTHGGSLRGTAQLAGGPRKAGASVAALGSEEDRRALGKPAGFTDFSRRIEARSVELSMLLAGLKKEGKRIAGYGAPAKATTLLHHFGLGDALEFIADDSPLKQGLLTPGQHIPVLPSSAVYERKPDRLLVLAWNFAGPIMEKHKAYREGGGRFILPLPEVKEL